MPSLNFTLFIPAVENGLAELEGRPLPNPGLRPKRQTIRKLRADGRDPKAGDVLHLYTGQRTKKCRKLGTVRCGGTCAIAIMSTGHIIHRRLGNWRVYSNEGASALASRDGFRNRHEMVAWFKVIHGLPFRGVVLRW